MDFTIFCHDAIFVIIWFQILYLRSYVRIREWISVLYSDLILWLYLEICKLIKSLRRFWLTTANCYKQITPNLIWIHLLSISLYLKSIEDTNMFLDELSIFRRYLRGANFCRETTLLLNKENVIRMQYWQCDQRSKVRI